jgi:hypothetical protein
MLYNTNTKDGGRVELLQHKPQSKMESLGQDTRYPEIVCDFLWSLQSNEYLDYAKTTFFPIHDLSSVLHSPITDATK